GIGAGVADIVVVGTAGGSASAEFAVVAGADATGVNSCCCCGMDLKEQMGFYQDSNGAVWLTGTYKYGFQDPKDGYDGYDDNKSKSYRKRRSPWGTKPWAVKVGDLTWDCGSKYGFKYQDCDGVKIFTKI
ncbi:41998_t:CDS:2, partial [Gigaspora margarita]